ncbi:MAG: hypothetical protein J2P37_03235 [Ktedonobacteraceae bacterium]|nr:hypothetical protein [Ktedonobacteraceae bacterium]
MSKKQERIELFERQIQRLNRRIALLESRSSRYSWTRVGIFFGGLALSLAVAIATSWWIGLILAALTLLVFGIVAHFHGKIDQSLARHKTWLSIKATHIARMRLDWELIPAGCEPGVQHPFESDLDITGPHSIHQLLNSAISREGSLRLRDWLLTTGPDLTAVQARQAIVRELTPLSRFRDRLSMYALLASRRLNEQMEGRRLLSWLETQHQPASSLLPWLVLATVLNLLTPVLFVLSFFVTMPQLWLFSILLALAILFATARRRGDTFDDAGYLSSGLGTLSQVFSYLQTYPYGRYPLLGKLCAPFYTERHHTPVALLRRTSRIASAATLKNNGLLWVMVNALLPWDIYCSYRLFQCREQIAARLPTWLDTWFELEALCSLATFAYLNPEYTLPDVAEDRLFEARDLGHPLIPVERKVTNAFTLAETGEVDIITGSNMAGKSTFLRTLGVNLALAYAGAPVNASMLRAGLFRLFSCIRVSDSVTDGYSYFYAEVRRLRGLLTELEQPDSRPLFFLIDEIFKGTNNRERLIGSRSFVRALVGRNCLGAISTHDLELVKLAEVLPAVRNYHFREEVVDGAMVFDYKLRPGPCPTTNALTIMRLEGLPVELEEEARS